MHLVLLLLVHLVLVGPFLAVALLLLLLEHEHLLDLLLCELLVDHLLLSRVVVLLDLLAAPFDLQLVLLVLLLVLYGFVVLLRLLLLLLGSSGTRGERLDLWE